MEDISFPAFFFYQNGSLHMPTFECLMLKVLETEKGFEFSLFMAVKSLLACAYVAISFHVHKHSGIEN